MAQLTKKHNTIPDSTARILTNVFSPITATLLTMIVLYFEYVRTPEDPSYNWLTAALVTMVVAILTFWTFLKLKLISDWDITKREQRPKVLALICGYLFLLTVVTIWLGHSSAAPILMLMTTGFVLASVITLFWKISFHTFIVTLFVVLLYFTYASPWIFLLLFIPILTAWTRIYLGKHTWKQAIGGIVLGLGIGVTWAAIRILVVISLINALDISL